ncbi:MAG: pseudouridine-5'-phosphate glycosidase [Bacilli bacterium]|nr:pseudouridine-5'-phosphate glycosidase [Bacilli bacterium]MDY4828108.1 pseudouridine-5'-phosphate glycosidase [Bacilli bacterium]MDY5655059.1 pseudouridine-5'-phosphate glycosidase [Bacilli bacterium]MDY5937120.1 pseudouridine-5'-phosphate glycosidase [Bacilli bacterium]MDY6048397.1 pseudouridine-5'-phosphate glycosidase [Bacilli bacterium]
MKISNEVLEALKNNKPVVALESTIISHGMPYPRNVECALAVEKVIRDNGAIPATIGIIEGEPIVGMSPEEIELFGKTKGISKVSRRDLPLVIASKKWGATTVSATMILAQKANIEFFVTGGIGGAHRKANETFDVSADLDELGKTDVTVICAGPKAILDLNLTMEYLETKGVPVIGYKTDKLPAFYTRESKLGVDYNASSPQEIAKIVKAKREYELHGGVLVCDPIPEEYSLDSSYIDKYIDEALKEMEEKGIKGKDETPFLLAKIVELTGGKSLDTNIKLILNNAKLGALTALEYTKLK